MTVCLLLFPSNCKPFLCVCEVEHDLDQIDFIDSCVTEEEEEEVRQAKCMESDSLSSQFMAYIEQRRISHEVLLLFTSVCMCVYYASVKVLLFVSLPSPWASL